MATATALLTAEEYLALPDNGQPTELVRGKVVPMNVPTPRHGEICATIVRIIGNFVAEAGLGRVVSNDSGVLTERDPDTLRGTDVAFYSFARVPRGPLPQGYLPVPPELVFEVRSPTDRWSEIMIKVGEYLSAGVSLVCVLDPQTGSAHLFDANQPPRALSEDEHLTFPGILGDFRAPVRQFFA
jgi:Uma2 family endonuclease